MKPVSKKMQKIIAFIPGLNIFSLPIFIYNTFRVKFTLKDYLRSWKYLVFPAVLLVILREVVICCFPTISVICGHICTYLILLVVGLRLIKFQECYF